MAMIQSAFTTLTGGKGNIGAWNRNVALWKGRAAAKRTEARINALEENVKALNNQQSEIANTVRPSDPNDSPLVKDTLKNINPLNVKNLTVTQIVVTGGSSKDKLKAEKIAEKNTKLLEQFNKATKEIAKNTKQIKKQDTKIRKRQSIKDRANNYAKTAKKLALKAAKKTKGWIANMKDYLISILPSLILATLMDSGAIMGKIVKKVTEKIRGGSRAERKAKKAKAAEWKEKETRIKQYVKQQDRIVKSSLLRKIEALSVRVKMLTGAMEVMEGEISVCCGLGKRKRKGGGRRTHPHKEPHKTVKPSKLKKGTKFSKVPKVEKAPARLFPKSVTNVVRKTKRSVMFKLLKKIGSVGLKSIVGMAGAAMAFAGPLISVLMGAWFAYDVVTTGLIMSGVITEEQLEHFEDFIIDKAKELASGAYKKVFGGADQKRQTSIHKDRVIKQANQYFDEAEKALAELREAENKGEKGYVIRRLRAKFGDAVTRYNKVVGKGGDASKDLKLYIYRHISQTNYFWHEKYRTDKDKMEEARYISMQMALYKKEKNGGVSSVDIKGTNVKSSSVQRSTALKAGSNIKHRTLAASMKKVKYSIEGVDTSKYQNDITFTLGTPVNGLYPPMWKPLESLVPPAYRKIIDYLENGNTANYALKGKRSSAFGRYQFMEKTARSMAKKTPDVDPKNWKVPENQDKIFATLYQENMRYLGKLAARGVKIDLMSLWISHNLGPGAVEWMLTGQGKPVPKHNIDLQLGKTGSTADESRQLYINLYKEKIAKAIGAPVGKGTMYGNIAGTGTPGVATPNMGGGSISGSSSSSSSTSSGGAMGGSSMASIKIEPWNGQLETNIKLSDVIQLAGSAAAGGWKGLKPEFKTRILKAAAAYKQITGKKLYITSAYRNPKHQAELYKKSNGSGMVAPPGRSMHNWGLAIDLGNAAGGLDKGPGNQGDILAKAGILNKFKLWRPMLGSHPYEPWHIEPIETKGHRGTKGQYVQLQSSSSMSSAVSNQTPAQFNAPVNPYAIAGAAGITGGVASAPTPSGVPVAGSTTQQKIHTGSKTSLKHSISVKERTK